MLGIGGSLQNQLQRQPPSDKHTRAVSRIHASATKDGDDWSNHDDNENEPSSKKRKRNNNDDAKSSEPPTKTRKKNNTHLNGSWKYLGDIIVENKKKLQDENMKNGVTFALIGSSGCGKSTVIRKVLIDYVFSKEKGKERGESKEFIVQIFTESAKSDAFEKLDKDIIVDSKGLDEHNINFCYHMNEQYDKKYNFLLILDDVLEIQYKKLVKRMFLTMRNTNISSIVSLQYPNLIPKSIRTSVYFTFLFHMNNDEAVELIVRGWLSSYLYGKNIREKMKTYLQWTLGSDKSGHNFFLRDNLNHKVYMVDKNYMCKEMPMITIMNDLHDNKETIFMNDNEEDNPQEKEEI